MNPVTSESVIRTMSRKPVPPVVPLGRLVRASWLAQVGQFFAESTLHGVRYIAEAGRPFWEHCSWFCLVAVSAVTTVCIILNLWVRFQTHPTITGPDTSLRSNVTVFPTVLVCPVEADFDEEWNETLFAFSSFERIGQVAGDQELMANLATVKIDNVRDAMFRTAIGCENVIGECWFRGERLPNCCKSFLPVFSEVGFCYAFSPKFYDTNRTWVRNLDTMNLFETDKQLGLTFEPLLKSRLFVHSQDELSGWDFRPQVLLDEGFAIDILISMKQTYTTEDARQLSAGQRKCIFPDEVKLRFYQDEYTFSGCMRECRLRKCIKYCRCFPPFYAPSVKPRRGKECAMPDLSCLAANVGNITSISGCQHCELSCHNTVYDIEKYSKVIASEVGKEPVVTIEFLTWPVIRYKREVLFGWVDLLVSFGGIAGLFLGFSLLSGVEIIYFFTMRACCMLYKNRDQLMAIERKKLRQSPEKYNLELKPVMRRQTQSTPTIDPTQKNVITLSLVEMEFNAVKVPKKQGLVLGGLAVVQPVHRRLERRLEKIKLMSRADCFRPVHVAPYSERIKPLDRHVVRTEDGDVLYNGYLP